MTKPKIAFIRVLGVDKNDSNTADYNIGLGYMASIAETSGFDVTLLDPYDPDVPKKSNDFYHMHFDIIGFTVHYLNIERTLDEIKIIKRRSPETIILLGGHHASLTAKELLDDIDEIDAICIGEGEEFIKQFLSSFKKHNRQVKNNVIKTKQTDIRGLPIPKHLIRSEVARISTSRGCPYSCSFCTTPAFEALTSGKMFRFRDPIDVVNEVEFLYNNGIKKIYINDDSYLYNNPILLKRAIEIANLLLKRTIKIEYKAQWRIDAISPCDEKLLHKLKVSGLKSVFLGIESGSDKILKEYNKKFFTKDFEKYINLYNKVGIQINAGNILASPDSSIEDIRQSIIVFNQLGLSYLFFRRVSFKAHIFPGTKMEEQLSNENRLQSRPRYLPRSYTFKDYAIDYIVNLFEEQMPIFLKDIGYSTFILRNQALLKYYNDRDSNASILKILNDWNNASTNILLKWFSHDISIPINVKTFNTDFLFYKDFVKNINRDLKKLL